MPTLERALASVRAQTYTDWELVAVDNGSSDGSRELLVAQGLRVVDEPVPGIAHAYNRGVAEARGDTLCFLGQDDEWPADRLEVLDRALAGGAAFAIGRARFHADRVDVTVRPGFFEQAPPMAWLPDTILARREVFTAVGSFDAAFAVATDTDWFRRLRQLALPHAEVDAVVVEKHYSGGNASLQVAANNRELLATLRAGLRGSRASGPRSAAPPSDPADSK